MNEGLFNVAGRVALVTGSSRGIGLAFARGLAERRARVVLHGRDAEALAAAERKLSRYTDVLTVTFDVTAPSEVEEAIGKIDSVWGVPDILVNNAGIQRRNLFTEFLVDDWNDLLATNITGPFLVGRAVARGMVERGSGKIINIASVLSSHGRKGIAPYAATKGAIAMLTKGMCADLAGSGVQVNALAPGYFDTALNKALVADEKFSEWVRDRTPVGRWGEVEDLIGTLIYLSSAASNFVNGQVIYVDGGMTSVL